MTAEINVACLEQWLGDGQELAVFDVREHGEYGEGHLFFAVPLPYSRLELDITRLAPSRRVRIVVYDDGKKSVAAAAVRRLIAIGYQRVYLLSGGTLAWSQAGYSLFEGVNVPSKTFGEQVEAIRHTPAISADALHSHINSGKPLLILDGRPFAEYQKMSIPGSVCCPNGELSVRIGNLIRDDSTPVVVNCAGRTRSIIGAQSLIDLGVKNPVYALENGTQGWMLADYQLEHQQNRHYADETDVTDERVNRARILAESAGASWVSSEEVKTWIVEQHTVYLLDVRTEAEFLAGTLASAQHAPGGQLQQATDQFVGVRNARLVLLDSENVRAPVTAYWLRQMGHQAFILQGGIAAGLRENVQHIVETPVASVLPLISPDQLKAGLSGERPLRVWDIRSSQSYREGHIPGSEWVTRSHVIDVDASDVVLVSDDPQQAAWFAVDNPVRGLLAGGVTAWQAAGGFVAVTPDFPPDAERIDYLFFTHDRHKGNKAAARQYLAWEQGLWQRLHPSEKSVFKPVMGEK
ncbi:rhodanese-like domain-containing protein [Raoultella sp. C349492]|uniref:rhodanese-like domain-containing protein n=1 Tax=Raoultella sp. C349492 TaxID=2970253 RepID=UPI0035C6A4C2